MGRWRRFKRIFSQPDFPIRRLGKGEEERESGRYSELSQGNSTKSGE